MEIEIALLISGITMAFGIYSGMASIKRHNKIDDKRDSAQMTMMIVKLESISEGISDMKKDLSHVKNDVKEITERLIVAEQSIKLAHRRINEMQEHKEGK